jgi:hypothetical protein
MSCFENGNKFVSSAMKPSFSIHFFQQFEKAVGVIFSEAKSTVNFL